MCQVSVGGLPCVWGKLCSLRVGNADPPCVLLLTNHFLTHTFDSFETTLNPPLEAKLVNVSECYLLRYLLSFTCSKLLVHLPCLSTGLV